MLIIHVRDAQGRACEGSASKETRMTAYKTSSRPNCWNRVLYQRDTFWQKKRQCDEFLLHCCIRVVQRCCATKFGWLKWARGTRNRWIHHLCGDVHGCCLFFTMTVYVKFGDISVYPRDTKNRTMSRHFLMTPPWRDIARICKSLMLKECIRLQIGGVLQLLGSIFFNLAPDQRELFGDEFSIAKRWSRAIFSTFK